MTIRIASRSSKLALRQVEIFSKAFLLEDYKLVEVSIVDCPNLRDWGCPSEGISGNQKIIDVGGEPYMHDPN